MKNLLNFLTVIIVMGVILFIFMKYCNEPNPDVIFKTDTIYSEKIITELIPDTIIKENIVLINDTIYINNEIIKIDTIFVYLDDYLAVKSFIDTSFNDSLGLFVINDSLYRNSIKYRHVERKTYDKTKTIYEDKNGLYLGLGIMNLNEPVYNVNLDFKYKKFLFGAGFNTNQQVLFRVGYKIK